MYSECAMSCFQLSLQFDTLVLLQSAGALTIHGRCIITDREKSSDSIRGAQEPSN